jgi:uncharacterized protein with LGFP repeats
MAGKESTWTVAPLSAVLLALVCTLGMTAPAHAATAAAVSPIDNRYNNDPAVAKLLGAPTSAQFAVAGGLGRHYKWGSLYWSQATGTHEVHGAIEWKYNRVGGPAAYGFPTTDERQVNNDSIGVLIGTLSRFQKGSIAWSAQFGPHTMATAIADLWSNHYLTPDFGKPIADQSAVARGGFKASFEKVDIYWSATTGAFPTYKTYSDARAVKFRDKYNALSASAGVLGLPTSDYMYILDDSSEPLGATQKFQFGEIVLDFTPAGQTVHELHGPIYQRWRAEGYVAGLGFPTSDVKSISGGQTATFERGTISWNASTNKTTVTRF